MQSTTLSRPLDGSRDTTDYRRGRSTRIKAIPAGGLALGLGAAVTLAAWNDSEFATGSFATGGFDMRGSLNGTTFTDHATTGTAAALSFAVNPGSLTPGDTVYAPYAVRLMGNSTTGATVSITSTTTGTVTGLTYRIIAPSSFGCTSATTGTAIVGTAIAVGTAAGGTQFTLPAGTGGADGAITNLCFQVIAGAGLAQNQMGTVTWDLTATSTS